MTSKLDLAYIHDSKIGLGLGFVWKHTFSGVDISTPPFANLAGLTGHPPFYASRERFVAQVASISYYPTPKSWFGISQFSKFWGRNTDVSTTHTIYYGTTL